MEKATGAIMAFIGIFLLYIAFFGPSGFGFSWSGNTYTDTFNGMDSSFWQLDKSDAPGATATFEGTYKVTWSSQPSSNEEVILRSRRSYDFSQGGSVELQLIGGDAQHIHIRLLPQPWDPTLGPDADNEIRVLKNYYEGKAGVRVRVGGRQVDSWFTSFYGTYSGSLKISVEQGQVRFYIDGSPVYTTSYPFGTYQLYIEISSESGPYCWGYTEVDNFILSLGAPSQEPPEPEPEPEPQPEPQPSPSDPITWLKNLLNDRAFRALLTMIGIALTGIGLIVIFVGGSSRRVQSLPTY